MRSIKFFGLIILFSLSACVQAQALEGSPDFSTIYHFALLNDAVRHASSQEVERTWSAQYDEIYVVDIARTRNRYFLGIDDKNRVQDVAIRGTANLRNALFDLRFLKSYSPSLGIRVHHGFEMMADVVYRSIRPYLRKGYPLRISGQSLGAAEALILSMILEKNGYTVERIITFGQPKVTDKAGVEAYAGLPLTRVVDLNDVVPLLPPDAVYDENPYVHFGSEIVLLEGDDYCIGDGAFSDRKLPPTIVKDLSAAGLHNLFNEHRIGSYVTSIRDKLSGAVLVPCSEANRYLPAADRLPPPTQFQ